MMKAVINHYDCLEHDPIDQWQPEDPSDINISINFNIGLVATAGDNFLLHVVTANQQPDEQMEPYTLVVDKFNMPAILASVDGMLEQCQGENWPDIAGQLSRLMQWEFANYQP